MPLVLASTSPYRRQLLERLRLTFECASPEVDETPGGGETAPALAARLAFAKAQALADARPEDCIIGADQVAELDGEPLGKPGLREAAIEQLMRMSGQAVRFHTAVCLLGPELRLQAMDVTTVQFRVLQPDEIMRYVDAEQPLDCAGSFKCEGLGISLFQCIETRDPTALVGLPLIALSAMLRQAGFLVP